MSERTFPKVFEILFCDESVITQTYNFCFCKLLEAHTQTNKWLLPKMGEKVGVMKVDK